MGDCVVGNSVTVNVGGDSVAVAVGSIAMRKPLGRVPMIPITMRPRTTIIAALSAVIGSLRRLQILMGCPADWLARGSDLVGSLCKVSCVSGGGPLTGEALGVELPLDSRR